MPNDAEIPLPPGAEMHPELRLSVWHPRGLLDGALADEILRFIEAREAKAADPFNRFANLSGLDGVQLTFEEVEGIAARRIGKYRGAPVKSAIYAVNPLAFGMARMYQQLMRRSPIEIRVFSELRSAAKWLEVPLEILTR